MTAEINEDKFVWHSDCRHFVGGLPCKHWRPCQGCAYHDPVTARVLIVMLGLLGDMLIASPLPARIKRDDPGKHITWLVDEQCAPLLRMNPYIDRVLTFDWQAAVHLQSESFNSVYSFERTPSAAALVDRIHARTKAGLAFGGQHNGLYAMDDPAQQFFLMNTWNDYRTRHNTKSWTELYFEVAGFRYECEPYVLQIPVAADERVRLLLSEEDDVPRICLNVGGSLSTKLWPRSYWLSFGIALLERGRQLVITGGPTDVATCEYLSRELSVRDRHGGRVCYTQLSIEEFAAVPAYCDLMVTGDSVGFHLALAHKLPCILLLGPTNSAEIVPKHITTVSVLRSDLACSPCAHQVACGGVGGCMDTITPDQALAEVERYLSPPEASAG